MSSTEPMEPAERTAGQVPARQISVRGTGRQARVPDVALLSLGVETRAATAASALEANRRAANAVLAAVYELAVEAGDVRTEHIGIHPEHDHQSGRMVGYVATNQLSVRLRDLDTTGGALDAVAAVAGDAIRIHGLTFELSDRHEVEGLARAAAVGDAFEQADQLAAAAGVRRGPVLSIRTPVEPAGIPRGVLATRMAAAEATPVAGGTIEVAVDVDVVFLIE